MAKKSSEVTELEKLRGEAWVKHCMKVAGCKSQAGLLKVVSAVTDKDLWAKYKNGNTPPKTTTVIVVDKTLNGTADTWFCGPSADGLPLWAILGANQEDLFPNGLQVCYEFLDAELDSQVSRAEWWLLSKKPIGSMTTEDKAQALLEATVPVHYWHRNNYVDHFPEDIEGKGSVPSKLVNRDEVFLTLEEFISKPNALSLAYMEGKKLKFRKGIGKGEFPILNKKRLVSLVALVAICGNTKELKSLYEFLKAGLNEALVDSFGKDIAEYVKSNKHI